MCGVKEDVVIKIEKGMLRRFGHIEWMNNCRITKRSIRGVVSGDVGRGCYYFPVLCFSMPNYDNFLH